MNSQSPSAASPAAWSSLSSTLLPLSRASTDFSRVALSVAALATMRHDLIALPSPSITAATPSGGPSSAGRGGAPGRRPFVGRAGRDLEVGRFFGALRRHVNLGDQLVLLQHGLVIAG